MSRRTEEVLADLVADLRPVQRLAAPGWRAAGWLATAAAIVGAAVAWHGLRPDIGARLALPYEVGQWLASVATGVLAAVAAFLVALPDRSPRWALLPLPALAVWLASLGWGCFADLARMGPQALALGTSWSCLRFIIGVGLPLLGSMLWVLRHAASIRPVPVALLAGLAAAPLCSAGLSLFHHLDAALMILLWHGGAIALVTGLGGAVGRTVYTR
ncbi:MAG TPA: NrsF family protein [Acetobacteraceae bacterium]|nr:NrsF family protein [Acetobacteraceae bacterium]